MSDDNLNRDELLAKLRALHEELASLEDVDSQTKQMLGQIAADIDGLVDQQTSTELAEDATAQSPSEIADRIEKFETDHPTVTRFLSQLTDLLAMLGI